jgi:hypothetical protein
LRSSGPFSVDDVIKAGSLEAALDLFVFKDDALIVQLRDAAKKAAAAAHVPFFNEAGMTWDGYLKLQMLQTQHPRAAFG